MQDTFLVEQPALPAFIGKASAGSVLESASFADAQQPLSSEWHPRNAPPILPDGWLPSLNSSVTIGKCLHSAPGQCLRRLSDNYSSTG